MPAKKAPAKKMATSKKTGTADSSKLTPSQKKNLAASAKNRTDRYGNSGMGETKSGVMKKDLKALAKENKKLPKDSQGFASSFTARGNINEIYFGPGFMKLNKKKK
jgi:hypothetical protein